MLELYILRLPYHRRNIYTHCRPRVDDRCVCENGRLGLRMDSYLERLTPIQICRLELALAPVVDRKTFVRGRFRTLNKES